MADFIRRQTQCHPPKRLVVVDASGHTEQISDQPEPDQTRQSLESLYRLPSLDLTLLDESPNLRLDAVYHPRNNQTAFLVRQPLGRP
jgi:hypothetical protein